MPAVSDDLTGSLNLITHGDDLVRYDRLVVRYRELIRGLCAVIEMECLSEYDYIIEIYDSAVNLGQRVINTEFPLATTSEDFAAIIIKMAEAVNRLEAVERVLQMCFSNNFIQLR
ncbi:hypothetical protein CRE_07252 [Caenorhabditis remanei]|uniref:Uncharacterized protein n=1 Tax=Caenorhabditis remanei TaxID=31234 RepID=E3M2C2_CAERE|nr:hypothetical protein CRE_07252 [Caenorhabditis remanei]